MMITTTRPRGVGLLSAFVATAFFATSARADFVTGAIPNLFNTGVDNSNVVLPDGANDPHYTLVSAPDANANPISINAPAVVVNTSGFPAGGPWMPNTSTSKWISITADQAKGAFPSSTSPENLNPVPYKYTMTFDLTGFNSATQLASITGQVASDNAVKVLFNGAKVLGYGQAGGFDSWHPFTFDSTQFSFISGLNTLEFDVVNLYPPPPDDPVIANPTGLRVEISGVVENTPTPEPTSLVIAATGVAGAGLFGWRRRRKSLS